MSIHNFTFKKVEAPTFPSKAVVKFEILGFTEYTDKPGLTIKAKVVSCESKEENIGKEVPFHFPFLTKTGEQNPAAYFFFIAMFPDHITKGLQLPYQMLTGSFFQATSKLNEYQGKTYQNWEGYKSLGRPDDDGTY